MTQRRIRPREADQLLKALEAGIVPRIGLSHTLVGRKGEVSEILRIFNNLLEGDSDFKLWVGDFGSGKSFMLGTIEQLGLEKNFVTSTVDLSPTRRFQASDGKAIALYQEIIRKLRTRTAQEGEAMAVILDQWLYRLMDKEPNQVEYRIQETIANMKSAGFRYELGQAILAYYQGLKEDNMDQKLQALRWLGGLIPTVTESKRILGIGKIVKDSNWFDMTMNLTELFRACGYAGLIINFDEVVNLYKLPRAQSRDNNYERVLNMYNACKSNGVPGLFVNLGATKKTVFDERRGLSSYQALKSRLALDESYEDLVDVRSTVQLLKVLSPEEIFTLLDKLQSIFKILHKEARFFSPSQIQAYMEAQLNRPGAKEFLTPRAVIKEFLQILSLADQNQDISIDDLLERRFGGMGQVLPDEDNQDDLPIEIY